MTNWNERLEQERLAAAKKAEAQKTEERGINDRLEAYLDKFQAERHLQDIKDRVWKIGSITQLRGREKREGWSNTWNGIEWIAFQLHFEYRDVDTVIRASGSDLLGPYYSRYKEIVTKNYDITVGAAYVPQSFEREKMGIAQGDYLYVIYPNANMLGMPYREWTMGRHNYGRGISMSKPEAEIQEYLEGQLLASVGLPLPGDIKEKADNNIELFLNK